MYTEKFYHYFDICVKKCKLISYYMYLSNMTDFKFNDYEI